MTLEEMKNMRFGERVWDKEFETEILRLHNGWIFRTWDNVIQKFTSLAFVPEKS